MAQIDTSFSEHRVPLDAPWILDPPSRLAFPPERESRAAGLHRALTERLSGPGGTYNVGNAIGLVGGIIIAVAAVDQPEGHGVSAGARAAFDYLAGSASAVCLTAAMLIFFWSGEAYHRAWANGFPPDPRRNRQGDLVSGVGAIALGIGLFLVGEPLLAATAGLLHATGKFGSALHPTRPSPRRWPDPWRMAVLVSRVPALALVTMALVAELNLQGGPEPSRLATPAMLLLCYLLWSRADILLFRA